jgi:hypothetical protein
MKASERRCCSGLNRSLTPLLLPLAQPLLFEIRHRLLAWGARVEKEADARSLINLVCGWRRPSGEAAFSISRSGG